MSNGPTASARYTDVTSNRDEFAAPYWVVLDSIPLQPADMRPMRNFKMRPYEL